MSVSVEHSAPGDAPEVTPAPSASMTQRLAAEGFGSFLLIFVGIGAALWAPLVEDTSTTLITALGFGLALLIAISVFGNISGGHLNPAVTFGFAIAGRTAWRDVPGYVIAQTLGAAAGAAVLFIVASTSGVFADQAYAQQVPQVEWFFTNASNQYEIGGIGQFSLAGILLIEVIATAILVGVILGVTRNKFSTPLAAPVVIGLTYMLMIIVTLPISTAGLNPARSTATALFADGVLGDLWLFWVAPLVGGALAALLSIGLGTDRVITSDSSAFDSADDAEVPVPVETTEVLTIDGPVEVSVEESVEELDVDDADVAPDDLADAPVSDEVEETVIVEVEEPPAAADDEDPTEPAEDLADATQVPAGHPEAGTTYAVKVAAGAETYHVPGSRYYEKTIAEVYFIDEQSAQDAGFRKAGTRKK